MKITITAGEAISKGVWDEICEIKGLSIWAVNEGQMDSDEEISLTEDQAKKLNLLPKDI